MRLIKRPRIPTKESLAEEYKKNHYNPVTDVWDSGRSYERGMPERTWSALTTYESILSDAIDESKYRNYCNICYSSLADGVVELREEDDYGRGEISICKACLHKALALIEEK